MRGDDRLTTSHHRASAAFHKDATQLRRAAPVQEAKAWRPCRACRAKIHKANIMGTANFAI